MTIANAPRQPLLHDALVALRAPTQLWSAQDGSLGSRPIHGLAHGDVRVLRGLGLRVGGEVPEHLRTDAGAADRVVVLSLVRRLDDATPDPGIRLSVDRRVGIGTWSERLEITNRHDTAVAAPIEVTLTADATPIDAVKQGLAPAAPPWLARQGDVVAWTADGIDARLTAAGWDVTTGDDGLIRLTRTLDVPPRGRAEAGWTVELSDPDGAVRGAPGPVPWGIPDLGGLEPTLRRWAQAALTDLDALRLTVAGHPDDQFLAAGAPWFFSLFGRDSLWAARMMLPNGVRLAGDTLRVLARLQGRTSDVDRAEEPGKIMHELRRGKLSVESGVTLPPLYYGTVDATPLWACLLHEAWRAGLDEAEVRALLPSLEAALGWMRDDGDADGDGLLEYIDRSGHGLANQGWKDSGDSIQWRDGTLAEGPIALCEVQAYAYQAAIGGAELIERFGADDAGGSAAERAQGWRAWAAALRRRFHEEFWITDPEVTGPLGPYPAVALDARKRRVDTVTSNLGHLLGTGLLDEEQARLVAARLSSPELDAGTGLRTMSTDAAGFWPLSYHGGSVWAHDTAIAVRGLSAEGYHAEALALVSGLCRAAEAFGYRMPELHAGDDVAQPGSPSPYPAACRPQAWSATAALVAVAAVRDAEQRDVRSADRARVPSRA
ncbi:MAG: amylo-alpha-1,6-glucosidase [Microbacterium sp.]|nr:amylo-alpha-1,6-glucosidase [Microbacterium sp.]